MNQKEYTALILVLIMLVPVGCGSRIEDVTFEIGIERKPEPQRLADLEPIQELPQYTPGLRSKPSLRGLNLTALDLSGELEMLLNSSFDTNTMWPESLPEGFDPEEILELSKDPGLNLRSVHEKGITGQGVGAAIIDYTLLVEHDEYKDQLRMYREVNHSNERAEFHGSSMASILAGAQIGVAPDADLYFVGVRNFDPGKKDIIHNQTHTAQALRGLINLNETLPESDKIRVISISQWWSPHTKGYREMVKAVEEARAAGIFVISCNLWQYNSRFHIHGLEREAMSPVDDFDSYRPAQWEHWLTAVNRNGHGDYYQREYDKLEEKQILLVPSAATTVAGAGGIDDYIFVPEVNWSNTIPYVAGLYVLACQVKPDITPELFWDAAYQTGFPGQVRDGGGQSFDARMVNPEALIDVLDRKIDSTTN